MKFFVRNTGKIEIFLPFAVRIFGIQEKAGTEKGSAGASRFLQNSCRTGRIPKKPPPA